MKVSTRYVPAAARLYCFVTALELISYYSVIEAALLSYYCFGTAPSPLRYWIVTARLSLCHCSFILQYNTIQYSAIQYNTIQYNTKALYFTSLATHCYCMLRLCCCCVADLLLVCSCSVTALFLLYLTNIFHVAVRLFSNRSQVTSKCGNNKSFERVAIPEWVTDVLVTFWRLLWSITEQMQSNMESICHIITKQITTDKTFLLLFLNSST